MASLLAAQQLLAGSGGQNLTASQQQQLVISGALCTVLMLELRFGNYLDRSSTGPPPPTKKCGFLIQVLYSGNNQIL